jgi:hypothetical protein
MSQSRTLYVGMDVHTESMAVASVAQAHGAEVVSLGTGRVTSCSGNCGRRVRRLLSSTQPAPAATGARA